jgi:hypothetical protein
VKWTRSLLLLVALYLGSVGFRRYWESDSQIAQRQEQVGTVSQPKEVLPPPARTLPKLETGLEKPINRAQVAQVETSAVFEDTQNASRSYAAKPVERDVVSFRVEDGYGVAFGDILIGEIKPGIPTKGRARVPPAQRWESPQIPYFITRDFPNPERVYQALEYLGKNTILNFVPLSDQKDAIVFENGKGCKSYVGRIGGHQPIRIGTGCGVQEILHEILHAIGFVHEQSREDRDQYVRVLWDNINPDYKSNFEIAPEAILEIGSYNDFDYRSIMLYQANTFARTPDLKTLESVGRDPIEPTGEGLSRSDISRIARLFH